MSILKELPELVDAGILSEEKAEEVRRFYRERSKRQQNRLPIVFGILGALLIGFGIILVVAHNWESLSRATRTVLSFLPLIAAQIGAGYVMARKMGQRLWTESCSILLFFAMGATLALVSQTYHLQGELSGFLLLWMLLAFPIPYLLRSPSSSLLYLTGIAYYGMEVNFDPGMTSFYAPLLLLILPYLVLLYRKEAQSNFAAFHNWVVPISAMIGFASMHDPSPNEWARLAFFSLMGGFLSIGQRPLFNGQKAVRNGYRRIGQLGTLFFLFMSSFEGHWEVYWQAMHPLQGILHPIGISAVLLFLAASILFSLRWEKRSIKRLDPFEGIFLLYPILFLSAYPDPIVPFIATNLIILGLGIHRMLIGVREERLATLNFGALIVTALTLIRFFEVDISFLAKGLVFIGLGVGFFLVNYRIHQKRSAHG